MKLLLALVGFLILTGPAMADIGSVDGTWQTKRSECVMSAVEKMDQLVAVKECRIRFQIVGVQCKFATVTYGTMIGKVLKRGQCFLDPDTKQLEIIVRDHFGQEIEEYNGFLEKVVDGFISTAIEARNENEERTWFYKL